MDWQREAKRLRAALEDIADPLAVIRRDAEARGLKLDGRGCVDLLSNANWLRDKARDALKGTV